MKPVNRLFGQAYWEKRYREEYNKQYVHNRIVCPYPGGKVVLSFNARRDLNDITPLMIRPTIARLSLKVCN